MADILKIGVLFGGRSNEKETSLDSGRNIVYKLTRDAYEIIPIFATQELELYRISHRLLVKNSTKDIEAALADAQTTGDALRVRIDDLSTLCDFVFIGLHGGEGENGSVQGALELLKIPYNGSGVFTSALCARKYQTTQYLRHKGFDTLSNILLTKDAWRADSRECLQRIALEIGYPVISKPNDDGCSVMVYKSANEAELVAHIEHTLQSKQEVLIEQCAPGIELTVGCIGNTIAQALVPTQTVSTNGVLSIEEKFLPGAGLNITPAELKDEDLGIVQRVIERAYMALGCKGYARLDCFFDPATKKIYIIDVNTLPGLTPATCIFHQAAELDISPVEFFDIVIQLGFENHGVKMHTNTHVFEHVRTREQLNN